MSPLARLGPDSRAEASRAHGRRDSFSRIRAPAMSIRLVNGVGVADHTPLSLSKLICFPLDFLMVFFFHIFCSVLHPVVPPIFTVVFASGSVARR